MLHVLKKISNSLSTDNSIPIFGYSINEADIASASFFCVVTLLYFVLLPYFTRLCCVLSPLLCPTSHFTDKVAAFVTLPSDRQSVLIDLFIIVRSVQHLGCRPKSNITCANPAFLPPPSSSIGVVPNSGKSPLSSGCFAIRRWLCRCPASPS